jgi:uncharacterized protein (TIGR02246 family)
MAGAMSAEDELSVRTLIAEYSDAIMCRDPAAAASVFAEDAVLEAFGGPSVIGRAAIETALRARLGPGSSGFGVQMTMTVGVRVDGDQALARSHYLEIGTGSNDGPGRLSMGWMEDRLQRRAEGWRIQTRELKRVYVGDLLLPGKITARDAVSWRSLSGDERP